jgi:adenosylcobinamide-GDP ribazoletransferase
MKSILIALQFLTRIPVKFREIPTDEQTAKSLLAYPLIGVGIGAVLVIAYLALQDTSALLRSALILTLWVGITGALHLDGLADSADALVGGFGDKNKTLAIMKDPNCGPVGVVVLILILLLKFSVLFSLSEQNLVLLLLAPAIARTTILWSFLNIPYVRQGGLGQSFSDFIAYKKTAQWLVVYALLLLFFLNGLGLVLLLATVITLYLLKSIQVARIEGMTGDTLGAQVEIIEVIILITGYLVGN